MNGLNVNTFNIQRYLLLKSINIQSFSFRNTNSFQISLCENLENISIDQFCFYQFSFYEMNITEMDEDDIQIANIVLIFELFIKQAGDAIEKIMDLRGELGSMMNELNVLESEKKYGPWSITNCLNIKTINIGDNCFKDYDCDFTISSIFIYSIITQLFLILKY